MASYLGYYKNAAKHREKKILRAIKSVLVQSYTNLELVVVSDGCKKTIDIVKSIDDYRISGYYVEKQPIWSGIRNIGIEKAKYPIITYLDTDDFYGHDHIEFIMDSMQSYDWIWFNDIIWKEKWKVRNCSLRMGNCGTSNVAHKKIALWNQKDTYAHDWNFIKKLMKNKNNNFVGNGKYYVCHIPGKYDV